MENDFNRLQDLYAQECEKTAELEGQVLQLGRFLRELMLRDNRRSFHVPEEDMIESSGHELRITRELHPRRPLMRVELVSV